MSKNYVIGFTDGSIYTFEAITEVSMGAAGEIMLSTDTSDDDITVFNRNVNFLCTEKVYLRHIQQR